jgi:hypothetical protein
LTDRITQPPSQAITAREKADFKRRRRLARNS